MESCSQQRVNKTVSDVRFSGIAMVRPHRSMLHTHTHAKSREPAISIRFETNSLSFHFWPKPKRTRIRHKVTQIPCIFPQSSSNRAASQTHHKPEIRLTADHDASALITYDNDETANGSTQPHTKTEFHGAKRGGRQPADGTNQLRPRRYFRSCGNRMHARHHGTHTHHTYCAAGMTNKWY